MRTTRRLGLAFATAALCAGIDVSAARAQNADGIQLLVRRLEQIVQAGDTTGYAALLAPAADREKANDFASIELAQAAARAVLQERDREPLRGAPAGEAYRLMVDAFAEFGNRARAATWRLDVRRVGQPGSDAEWAIVDE